ncbi:glycosyltransferase family 4 protein [Virgibacillus sp. MG-45]|uniref:glycosyltransferase family 4 protein n=1 Tax=Virgibacillus sp. MG-45 TaxID=3102791 RepID=UPI002EDB1515
MNIWIFNHYAVGPNSSGGTRHFDLAKQLVKNGHRVTIFASSYNHQTLEEEQFKEENDFFKEKEYDGVKFIWIKTIAYKKNDYKRVLNMLGYTRKSLKIGKQHRERPDIVIGSLVHPLAAYVGYKISRHYKSVFYFEERDLWPQTLLDLGKYSEYNPLIILMAKVEKFLFKKADKVIVLFDKAVKYVETKGIPKEKILYIPNGYDIKRTSNGIEVSEEINNLFQRLEGQIIGIYTGAHGIANNLDVILDSAKVLQDRDVPVSFILIGNGTEKERLVARARDEKIENIYFISSVPKEMIPSILKKANVGLLPLADSPVFKWGISPNKLFDYMGSELPVLLLCDLDGTPVELADGGKVIRRNFVDGTVNFFSEIDADNLKKLGANGKKYVEENHSWNILASILEQQMIEDLNNK